MPGAFYDDLGRVRILHGTNRVAKGAPWLFVEMLDKDTLNAELDRLEAMGMSIVRHPPPCFLPLTLFPPPNRQKIVLTPSPRPCHKPLFAHCPPHRCASAGCGQGKTATAPRTSDKTPHDPAPPPLPPATPPDARVPSSHPLRGVDGECSFNPSEGVFNETYAEQMTGIVDALASRGIYTLLDMHQDILSLQFCTYDGVPPWVIAKIPPRHAFPWPFTGNCSSRGWMTNALTEAAAQA